MEPFCDAAEATWVGGQSEASRARAGVAASGDERAVHFGDAAVPRHAELPRDAANSVSSTYHSSTRELFRVKDEDVSLRVQM